jgi:putative AlgH/UPF0301 family transcriptional regulator
MAGLVAWNAGELQGEIELGAWHIVDAEPSMVTRRSEDLWESLVHRTRRLRI